MKALLLTEYNRFEYTDVPEPEVGPHDVLVRVRASGICGSDIHGMDGSSGRRIPPVIMGHEASGEIARMGPGVTGWATGDRVTFDSTIYCGTCETCRSGLVNLCPTRRVIGVSCDDYRQNGTFAEYVAVPEHILYRLPDEVSFVAGAAVEPLAIAAHAISRTTVRPGDTAVVVGAGVIGLMLVSALRAIGCTNVIILDINQTRLDLALRAGASHALRSDQGDPLAAIRELTTPDGADVAFEAVGITPTIVLAVTSVRKGGAVVLVGNVSPRVEIPLQTVVTRQLSLFGTAASAGEYPACLEMIASGRVDAEALVSAVRPLAEGGEWFARLHAGDQSL
ncbi:MAG: galactitol-1-phosphate 5-dehydrogenase, partial [Chloroflexota bacterium]